MLTERGGGAAAREGALLVMAAPHPFPFVNGAIAVDSGEDFEGTLERANSFFAKHDRPRWTLFTRETGEDEALEEAARSRGMEIVNPHYPEMICRERVAETADEGAVELREVGSTEDARAYWRICATAYESLGFPRELFEGYPAAMLNPPVFGCLAWSDAERVGAAMGIVLEGVGLVFWVGSLPAARGRGIGAAVTAWVTNRAFDEGADFVSLQASPMGLSVYERLGYERVFDYRVWRVGAT